MNVHTPEFARQYQSYKEIRARLFGPAKPAVKAVAAPAEPIISKPVVYEPPLWKTSHIHFNWHELVWREVVGRNFGNLAEENAKLRAIININRLDLNSIDHAPKSADQIIFEVLADFPGVTIKDVKGRHRTRNIVYPRQLCMYEVYMQRQDMSFPMIGRVFGSRDHTTVMWSVRKVQSILEGKENPRKTTERLSHLADLRRA